MPLEIYKRRHGCDIETRIDAGEIKIPKTESRFGFLQQYPHCKCAWWVRGTNDYGKTVQVHSLKVYSKEAALAEVKKLNQPNSPNKARVSLEVAKEMWLTEVGLKEGRPVSTVAGYRNALGKLLTYCADRKIAYVADIGPEDVNALRAKWIAEKAKQTTRVYRITVLSIFFNWAVRRDLIPTNPLHKISGVSYQADDETVATLPLDPDGGDANYRKFLDGVRPYLNSGNHRMRRGALATRPDNFIALCELMYHTGLRVGDAIHFTPDEMAVYAERGCATWTRRQQKSKRRRDGGRVTVYLPIWLAEKIAALPRISGPYVFLDPARVDAKTGDARIYIAGEVNVKMRLIGQSVGLPGLRPHRFRDQFALNQWAAGHGWDEVAELLGHADPAITRRYYAPWCKARETVMMDKLFPVGVRNAHGLVRSHGLVSLANRLEVVPNKKRRAG